MTDSNQEFPEDVNTIPAEDGKTWVEIASTGTKNEAEIVQGFLEAEGIPAQIEDVKFTMEPVNFGMLGDIRIYVPSEDEARAQELMQQRERAFEKLEDDDQTLVTEDGTAIVDESAAEDGGTTENDDGSRT